MARGISINGGAAGLRWRVPSAVLAIAVILVACLLAPAGSRAAAGCDNEAIREDQGATFLPECRAYELVGAAETPPATLANVSQEHENAGYGPGMPKMVAVTAAVNGGKVVYADFYPNPEGSDGAWFLSSRTGSGWLTEDLVPPESAAAEEISGCGPVVYPSSDLSENLLRLGGRYSLPRGEGFRASCGVDRPALVAGEPEGGFSRIFWHEGLTGAYRLLSGATPHNAALEGVSTDFTHVLFEDIGELVGGAPSGLNLYEWSQGAIRLVTYLPSGQAVQGQLVGSSDPRVSEGHMEELGILSAAPIVHSVSANGERVFFEAEGNLYVRENAMQPAAAKGECGASEPGLACTLQIDAEQGGTQAGGGTLLYVSADGSRVFFTDERDLTANATAISGKPDLYEYDLEAPAGDRLTDLTVDAAEPAAVVGLSGASEDGSYLYFVAEGRIAGKGVLRGPNLYVEHEGSVSFIATLNKTEDGADWAQTPGALAELDTATAPSGHFFAFQSVQRLTGYDNLPAATGECVGAAGRDSPCSEVYLYSAAGEGALACASCNSPGVQPTGPSGIPNPGHANGASDQLVHARRWLLEDGTLFFESTDALIPQLDTGGATNVYEYADGRLSLISDGASSTASVFGEASANGEDVFLVAPTSLVAADTGGAPSLYDARVNGGLAAQNAASVPPEPCALASTCRGPLAEPPVQAFGASAAFSGAGDLTPTEARLKEPQSGIHKGHSKHRLTRAQKLKRALKACGRRHRRHARRRCRRRARRRFGTHRKRVRAHRRKRGHRNHKSGGRRR